MDSLVQIFDASDFPARWKCGAGWTSTPFYGWLHIGSDLGIWSAYLAIPLVLGYFAIRKKDLPFRSIFLLFVAFILACGTTHLVDAIIFWWPAYRLAAVIKVATAAVSWATVIALAQVAPEFLAMRGPAELQREIDARQLAEAALITANDDLRNRVEALRASEERFRLLVEGTKDYSIFLLDPHGQVASWNPGAERVTQYAAAEIIGSHVSRFYTDDDQRTGKPREDLEDAATTGAIEDEGWRVRKDGTTFWASVIITALRDPAGKLRGFSKVTRDITEKKKSLEIARNLLEEETARRAAEEHAQLLWEQRERLRVTLASIGDAVICTDADGRVTLLNPIAQALTGWTAEDADGTHVGDVFRIVNESTGEPIENPALRALTEGPVTGQPNHTILIARDGTERPIDDNAAPIKDGKGVIVGAVLVFRDVTERRLQHARLRDNQERLAIALEASELGQWDLNLADGTAERTPFHDKIFGYDRMLPKWTYQMFLDHVIPDDRPAVDAKFRQAVAERSTWETECRIKRGDGAIRWIGTKARIQNDARGQASRMLGTVADITERRQMENHLRDLGAELSEANRRKDEFLATLAHELRNPLAPIHNSLQIMRLAAGDQAAVTEAREIMERQLETMVRLVDDLMDVSRITTGKIELIKERVELADVIRNAVETSRPLIESSGHDFTVALPPAPIMLLADRTRLAQVFSNLLNNAARYTDRPGKIELTVDQRASEAVVTVSDTGIGIPPEMLARVFDMFTQIDRSLEQSHGGLGIGLTLVRRLTELHGGTVEAQSAGTGRGSQFIVRLPLLPTAPQPTEASPAHDPMTAGPRPRRILIVDDNEDSVRTLSMLLRAMGHDTQVAHDGLDAVEATLRFRPDLILLDIGLPGLNGYEACKRIRQQPGGRSIVIAALTGWGQADDRRLSREAGFDHHFVKPVQTKMLENLIATLKTARDWPNHS